MIAAIVGAVAVLAVIGWLASPSEKGNQGSTDTGNQGSTSGHTKSYNAGYSWAYNNKEYYGTWAAWNGVHATCAGQVRGEAPVQGLNSEEWLQGCEDSFHIMGYNKP
jgi:hypothetical protein